jgi:hypothetical protein
MVLATPAVLPVNVAGLYTNNPVDIVGFCGVGTITLLSSTNAGGTLTATIQTSPDTTNWTDLANFALVNSQTSFSITNGYYGGTNLYVTDAFLLPYTSTTPVAATAGFATPYSAYLPFTNSGAVTITTAGAYQIGVNLSDSPRYLHLKWTATAAATNGTTVVGALLNGVRTVPLQ